MAKTIRLLIVDDSPNDAELVAEQLRGAGLPVDAVRVDTPRKMSEALDRGDWDAIIADYKMPGFGCLAALKMMQERAIDLPFIVVSGAIGEETAVEAMRAGAHDYVLKQALTRLPAAVTRELRDAQVRRERRQAIEALRDLARRSAFLAEASRKLTLSLDYNETLARASRIPLPEAADWCLLTVARLPGSYVVLLGHADRQREVAAQERLGRVTLDPQAREGPLEVIRSGALAWTTQETALVTTPRTDGEALVRELGHHSGVSVPLLARGRTLGAMTLVRSSVARPFGAGDLAFAEELAARAAMALDNAGLYGEVCEAVKARDEFLSVASHELNTPLATLTLQLDDLLRSPEGGPRTMSDRGMALARSQVSRLSRLVWDLLDVTRISAGQIDLRLTEMDLERATRDVLAQFAAELSRAGCAAELDARGPVLGRWDPMRIEQVIANLLSNACKYGAGKPIRVSVRAENGVARLAVQDHGIGITPEDRDRIFERYERVNSGRHYGGLGLGLYITRQVVQAHGGSIAVASEAGAGSTFRVELPLRVQGLPPPQASHVGGRP